MTQVAKGDNRVDMIQIVNSDFSDEGEATSQKPMKVYVSGELADNRIGATTEAIIRGPSRESTDWG